MGKYLLDTNALISLIEKNDKVTKRFRREILEEGTQFFTTSLNYYEYIRGIPGHRGDPRRRKLKEYLQKAVTVIHITDLKVIDQGGDIFRKLVIKGKKLKTKGDDDKEFPDDVDILTAAISIQIKAVVVTHDPDFGKIDGVSSENWEK